MARPVAKTIDRIEQDQTFIFGTRDANAKEPVDQRTVTKEFLLERDDTGLYSIKLSAGGEVPDTLKGRWTNLIRATAAIENHLATKAQAAAAVAA